MPGYQRILLKVSGEALAGGIAKFIQTSPNADNNFIVQIQDQPYLLFYKVLNPGSRFAPAYEISLYSMSNSLVRQRRR